MTVGLVDIKPKISYTSIPQRVPHAFMLAKVTNNSPYTFLSGETSIFLDNTFVGKVSLGWAHWRTELLNWIKKVQKVSSAKQPLTMFMS